MVGWSVLATGILVAHILQSSSREAAASLAWWMTFLAMPLSPLAGIVVNEINSALVQAPNLSLYLIGVWVPFFICGLVQWAVIGWLVDRWKARKR